MSYIPVIRTITDYLGAQLEPADELRCMPGLTARYVPPGNGPARVELSPTFSLESFVPQPALAATGDSNQILVAASDQPRTFTGIKFYPSGAVSANNTNYRKLTIVDYDPVDQGASPILLITTKLAPVGTGSWVLCVTPFVAPAFGLGAGHFVVASWESSAAGVAIPGGAWRLTQ